MEGTNETEKLRLRAAAKYAPVPLEDDEFPLHRAALVEDTGDGFIYSVRRCGTENGRPGIGVISLTAGASARQRGPQPDKLICRNVPRAPLSAAVHASIR
jgi:hypothetical protein